MNPVKLILTLPIRTSFQLASALIPQNHLFVPRLGIKRDKI